MVNRILVASYTTSVQTLTFDASASALTVQSAVEVGFHPSWIEFYPSDHSLVFAGLETTEGKVVAVKYDESGTGSVVAETSSGGADPCSLAATENELLVANVRVVRDFTATLTANHLRSIPQAVCPYSQSLLIRHISPEAPLLYNYMVRVQTQNVNRARTRIK